VDVPPGAAAEREEIFGPVVPVAAFTTEDEAIIAANRTEFGLSAYVYTEDHSRVMRMLDALEFGEVFINRAGPEEVAGFHTGWGDSGLGGDDGTKGLELYTRTQTVYRAWRGQP
jgi:lactaldehyde dehydrogenase/glycolaldehyde dehydrogenase